MHTSSNKKRLKHEYISIIIDIYEHWMIIFMDINIHKLWMYILIRGETMYKFRNINFYLYIYLKFSKIYIDAPKIFIFIILSS